MEMLFECEESEPLHLLLSEGLLGLSCQRIAAGSAGPL